MQYGSKISGRYEPFTIALDELPVSKPNEVFEFQLQTEGIQCEEAAITQLLTLEEQFPDLRVAYAEADKATGNITFQIVDVGPGGFSLAGIFSAIPAIFIIVGIIIFAGVIYQIWATIPWVLPLAIIVGGVAVTWLLVGDKIPKVEGQIYTKGPKAPSPSEVKKLREGQINIRRLQSSVTSEIKTIEKKKTGVQKKIDIIEGRISTLENEMEEGVREIIKQGYPEAIEKSEIKAWKKKYIPRINAQKREMKPLETKLSSLDNTISTKEARAADLEAQLVT